MNKKQYKKSHGKGDMIKQLQEQQALMMKQDIAIRTLQYDIFLRDQLNNPCHESERMVWEEKNKK